MKNLYIFVISLNRKFCLFNGRVNPGPQNGLVSFLVHHAHGFFTRWFLRHSARGVKGYFDLFKAFACILPSVEFYLYVHAALSITICQRNQATARLSFISQGQREVVVWAAARIMLFTQGYGSGCFGRIWFWKKSSDPGPKSI